MNRANFSGRTIFISGATGGVGAEAARALHALGAEVIVGSRDPSRYAVVATELGRERVHPFIADITDAQQVKRELERMFSSGLAPSDVVHAAAGGMEPLLRDVARLVAGLRNVRGAEMDQAHTAARKELVPLVVNTRALAMAVNFAAPSRLLEALAARMRDGGSIVFFSSLWASLYPHPQIPVYYEAVAEAKQALEHWLESKAASWASRHITTAVISANLVLNTRMGYLLDRWCAEPMPPDHRARWRSSYVSSSELVDATLRVLHRSTPNGAGGIVREFLPGPGKVVEHLSAEDPPMQYPVALARNAPRWSEETPSTAG
jgi:NAD(P)-dependent dehydrogenase (short-subunit alcohol dehydrogenase family)